MKVLFTDPVSTTSELDLLIRILSAHTKIFCVLLVIATILTTLHSIKKDIKFGYQVLYNPDF